MGILNDVVQSTLKPNGGVSDNPINEKENERKNIQEKTADFEPKNGQVKKLDSQKSGTGGSGRKRNKSARSTQQETTAGNQGGSLLVWQGYGVKVGTRLEFISSKYKPSKKVHAEVANLGSMQLKLFVDGKQVKIPKPYGVGDGTTDGLVGAEAYVRAMLCSDDKMKQKVKSALSGDSKYLNKSTRCLKTSVCQGWDVWTLPYKGKPETIHQRWQRLK